ncbi:hypothetical protein DVH24_035091 [Malus domestica]|uniref:Uncharacterized protein n=1 Tax=Malus domestica TaxID=3750 RepID=A0A498IEM5_MALDO|nr:hypothetical protein DVH24_035091 [Malus domestica]
MINVLNHKSLKLDFRVDPIILAGKFTSIEKSKLDLEEMGYIGAHGVTALHKYKYSGVDHSYTAKYVLQPFWSSFVKIFPLWMP